jgi:hypothetical protein
MAEQNISIEIAYTTYTTTNGLVTSNQTLNRGGLTFLANAAPEAGGGPVYTGIFSGGMATCDDNGHLTFQNPPPAVPTRRNYIIYNPNERGRILIQPAFNWLKPDGQDGPAFLFSAFRYDGK